MAFDANEKNVSIHGFEDGICYLDQKASWTPCPGIYLIGFLVAMLSFLDFSDTDYMRLQNTLRRIAWFAHQAQGIDVLVHKSIEARDNYLVSSCLSGRTHAQHVSFFGEQPFSFRTPWSQVRGTTVLVSEFQMQQAANLHSKGLFASGDYRLIDQQKYLQGLGDATLVKRPIRYDIGFISSGIWARPAHADRAEPHHFQQMKEGTFVPRPDAGYEMELFRFLISFAEKRRLSLALYLHPYEKQVIEMGVTSPWERMDGVGTRFVIPEYGQSSVECIAETRVQISVISTLIWKCIDFGMTDAFQSMRALDQIGTTDVFLESCGPWRRHYFQSFEELEDRLDTDSAIAVNRILVDEQGTGDDLA
ncbi:MAG: hypothetical protein LBS17_01190 [Actinomycetes bacterium]|jgi:hypothetical protein|nr:hypothetical protein [Actinomycetes bacterium]